MNRAHEKKLRWARKTRPYPRSNRLSKLRLLCVPFFFSLKNFPVQYSRLRRNVAPDALVRGGAGEHTCPIDSGPHSPLSDRNAFRISRLILAASCEEESINWAQRLLSPSSFPWLKRYAACKIASRELLRS